MNIIEKILDWEMNQIKQGFKPKRIALSPWDVKELEDWVQKNMTLHAHEMYCVSPRKIIFGLEIIDWHNG